MQSRARLLGHSVHQMLIMFPLGLLATALIFDLIARFAGRPAFGEAGYYMVAAGIIGGLAAAVFGLTDWLGIPSATRARRVGALHGVGNVVVVVLFLIAWFARRGQPAVPTGGVLTLEIIAVLLALCTGWLGGELVDRLGIGVDDGAHADAPSSLSGRPARQSATVDTGVPHRA